LWCAKKINEENTENVIIDVGNRQIAFDSLKHKKDAAKFLKDRRKTSRTFGIVSILSLIGGFLLMNLLSYSLGGFVLLFSIGLIAIRYPYIFPPLWFLVSMKNSATASKIIGVFSIALGILFLIGYI
jgi:hypothetical protein